MFYFKYLPKPYIFLWYLWAYVAWNKMIIIINNLILASKRKFRVQPR